MEIVESEYHSGRLEFHREESGDVGATELSAHLWKERALVELLLFKLEELELLLAGDRSRWIPQATKEIEQVLERMSMAGLDRAIDVSEVAEEWGCAPEATLRDLVAAAPPAVWADIFGSHLRALTELTGDVRSAADTSQHLLRAALQTPPTDARKPGDPASADNERALELATRDANYRVALAVTSRVLQPALEDFLG